MSIIGRRGFSTGAAALLLDATCAARTAPVRLRPSGGDDARAIADAFARGADVMLAPGDYVIGAMIEVPPHRTLGGSGARVRAASATSGRLRANGTHVQLSNGSRLLDLSFAPQPDTRHLTPGITASVIMLRGSDALVRGVTVEAVPPANAKAELQGLIVAGVGNCGNRVERCTFRYCGVHYSYGAAIGTQVTGCTFERAPGNALTGLCTVSDAVAQRHVVADNRILFPGRMGIEDFSRLLDHPPKVIRGTQILRNEIVSDARATPAFFAISAVGMNSLIEGNRVLNWPRQYAIEVGGGRGAVVRANVLRWTDGNPHHVVGVQVQAPAHAARRRVQVIDNRIDGASAALLSRGQDVLFARNTVIDPGRSAADYDAGAGLAEVVDNVVEVRRPAASGVRARILFSMTGRADFHGNRIRYAAAALGVPHREFAIITGGNDSRFFDNSIDVTGTARAGTGVIGITTNGMRPHNLLIAGMRSSGPVIGDYANMVTPSEPRHNEWAGGVRGRR